MSTRGRIIAALVGLAVVGGIAGYVVLGSKGSGPEIETAKVSKQELAVVVTASGKIEAGVQLDIYPPAAGTLDQIFVSDGETVTAGDKIATMDTDPLELQVAQARAALSQARAQLASVNQQVTGTTDLSAAQANVAAAYQGYVAAKAAYSAVGDQAPNATQIDAAEAATAAAYRSYQLAHAAAEAMPTSTTVVAMADQALVAYLTAKATEEQLKSVDLSAAREQAHAGVDQAYAAWKGAEAQLSKLRRADFGAARAAAEAGVKQAAHGLALAEKALDDATMVAPIDGIVIFNNPAAAAAAAAGAAGAGGGGEPAEGSAVSPQAAPFSVVDLSALRFTAEVDEADIQRVKVGMPATVELDSFPGEEFLTRVVRVNPVAQMTATGGTVFEVEMSVKDTGKDVLIGMKGDATIEVSSQPSALTIPVEALFSEGGTDYVYVVADSKLKKTEITAGATTDTEVEVLSGLDEGDTVALSGSTQYVDGMSVRIKSK